MKLNVQEPQQLQEDVFTSRIIENEESRTADNDFEYKEIKHKRVKFLTEYAISGWFKLAPI